MKSPHSLSRAIRQKTPSSLLLAITLASAAYANASNDYITISNIQCDDEVQSDVNDVAIFSESTNSLISWSHIANNPSNFTGLKFAPNGDVSKYRVAGHAIQNDSSCTTGDVFKTILVKKYANWDQQHANGLGHDFVEKPSYGEFQDIVLDIKLNSDETYINHEEYLNRYKAVVNEDTLKAMDSGFVNLGIELTGSVLQDDSTKRLNAKVNIELDQNDLSDEWLRLVIPVEAFNFYTQEANGYTVFDTNLDISNYPDNAITALRLNPETHTGQVLRNHLQDAYQSLNITESYKEEGVSIHNLYFRLKDEGETDGGNSGDDSDSNNDNDDSASMPIIISPLLSCQEFPELNALTIYDQSTDHLTNDDAHQDVGNYETHSWSKIYDSWDATSATTFSFSKDDYSVKLDSVQSDDECGNLNVMKTVLVKKYANWDSQHMSGLDYRFPAAEMTLRDLKDVALELKVNSDTTAIPSHEDVVDTYKEFVDESVIEALDQSKVNLTVLVFGEAFDDPSTETLVAKFTLNLDQNSEEIKDKWLRIVIPANALHYETQLDWAATMRSREDYLDTKIVGFKIHPETLNNKVIRNSFNSDDFASTVPELYKEMGISVRKAVLHLNSTDQDSDDQANDDDSSNDDSSNDDSSNDDSSNDDSSNDDSSNDDSSNDDSSNDDSSNDDSSNDDSSNDDSSNDDNDQSSDQASGNDNAADSDDDDTSSGSLGGFGLMLLLPMLIGLRLRRVK